MTPIPTSAAIAATGTPVAGNRRTSDERSVRAAATFAAEASAAAATSAHHAAVAGRPGRMPARPNPDAVDPDAVNADPGHSILVDGSGTDTGGGTPQQRFAALVEVLRGEADVDGPDGARRGFGATGLTVHGRIFAMLTRDQLVVKLPRARVLALVADGTGSPFTAGKTFPMKEWVTVGGVEEAMWVRLAREALTAARAAAAAPPLP